MVLFVENIVFWNSSWWLVEGIDDLKKLKCEVWRMIVFFGFGSSFF